MKTLMVYENTSNTGNYKNNIFFIICLTVLQGDTYSLMLTFFQLYALF